MTSNKQSSVELFAIALYEGGYLQGNGDEINDLLESHKAMHKEEMCQFAFDYYDEYCNNGIVPPIQDYYNEYFNTKDK